MGSIGENAFHSWTDWVMLEDSFNFDIFLNSDPILRGESLLASKARFWATLMPFH